MSNFAIAAGDHLTAEAAADVLRAGGNAVDAAIAAAMTACVTEPVLASLLGGGFMMVRQPDGKAKLLDFFVQTPKRKVALGELDFRAIEADFGETTQSFHIGAGSIATPGVARGLAEAHARYGVTPFTDLAAPATRIAKEGVPLAAFQAGVLEIVKPIYVATPEAAKTFGNGERPLQAGEILRNPALADVIETFAREGDRFMYEGEVAGAILSLDGGHLSADDLKDYQAVWREPLVEKRGGARIIMNPPPALGGALISFALRMMAADDTPTDITRAFAATSRARVESRISQDAVGGASRLLAPDLVVMYQKELMRRKAAQRGTTHISVIDKDGLGAAITLSNGEGCGLIAPGTGLMPNNMLGEEDLMPGDWHEWGADMRLSSMMTPMSIEWPDGRAVMMGSGGSNRIRTALARVASQIVDHGARLEQAINAPRIHVEGADTPRVDFEDRFRDDHRAALLSAFPEATPWSITSMFFGGVHGVQRDAKGGMDAAGDPRRNGIALVG
ncbi:MAG: gamma-glutamyltransferase [Pikeienuella sp.]